MIALGKDLMIPAASSPVDKIGFIMFVHCCLVNVVVTNGYLSFLMMTCQRPNSAAECETLAIAIDCCHCLETSSKYFASALLLLSGVRHTLSVHQASDRPSFGIIIK